MTPTEFKAWFEGFCEAIDAAPTPEQWAKIKAKVADMGGPDIARLGAVWMPHTVGQGTGTLMPDRNQAIA